MLLRCKYQGKPVKDLMGQPLACRWCKGIEFEGNYIKVKVEGFLGSLPRIPWAMFNCPATLPDPRKSNLIIKER